MINILLHILACALDPDWPPREDEGRCGNDIFVPFDNMNGKPGQHGQGKGQGANDADLYPDDFGDYGDF